ncbi:hypothetical protein [Nocardia sp. NPDC050175]|uniref:hypothetical protein n=1 Tax=Nocardia sp. NPDC050175 TaxID=3364317 RepID=UPI0037AC403D
MGKFGSLLRVIRRGDHRRSRGVQASALSVVKVPVLIDKANNRRIMELLEVVANLFTSILSLGSGSAA